MTSKQEINADVDDTHDCVPPPAREYKPGEKVLVEAEVETSNNGCAVVKIKGQWVSLHEDLARIRLGTSSIRPMTRKDAVR